MNRHLRNLGRGETTSKRREKGSSGGYEGSRDEEEKRRIGGVEGEEEGRGTRKRVQSSRTELSQHLGL